MVACLSRILNELNFHNISLYRSHFDVSYRNFETIYNTNVQGIGWTRYADIVNRKKYVARLSVRNKLLSNMTVLSCPLTSPSEKNNELYDAYFELQQQYYLSGNFEMSELVSYLMYKPCHHHIMLNLLNVSSTTLSQNHYQQQQKQQLQLQQAHVYNHPEDEENLYGPSLCSPRYGQLMLAMGYSSKSLDRYQLGLHFFHEYLRCSISYEMNQVDVSTPNTLLLILEMIMAASTIPVDIESSTKNREHMLADLSSYLNMIITTESTVTAHVSE